MVLDWARHGDERILNVVVKGLDWTVPNSLVKAYLECYGQVAPEGVRWADMHDTSWLAEKNPSTGIESKLASGERLAKLTISKSQLPRDHIMFGKRFVIEHKGQKTCKNCLRDSTECILGCNTSLCRNHKDLKKE